MQIHLAIKARRQQSRVTQAALAQKIGVTQGALQKWEDGSTYPSLPNLVRLADALGCTLDALIERK